MTKPSRARLNSKANKDDVRWYTGGECHILAVALHRQLGWPILVVREREDTAGHDGIKGDISACEVHHVYAVSPDGWAWDIRGAVPVDRIDQDIRNHFRIASSVQHLCVKEREMMIHVRPKDATHDHRALVAYSNDDVDESWKVAQHVFAGMEAFEKAASMKRSRKKAAPSR